MAVIVLQWTSVILLLIHLHVAFTELRSAAGCLGASSNISFSCAASEYMNITDIRVAVTKQKIPSFCNAPLTDQSHCRKSVTDSVRNMFMECNSHSSCSREAETWMDDGVLADCLDDFTGDKYITLSYNCFTKDGEFYTMDGEQSFNSSQNSLYVKSPNYGKLLVDTYEFCRVMFNPRQGPRYGYTFIIQGIEGYSSVKLEDNKPTCAYIVTLGYYLLTGELQNQFLCPDSVGKVTANDPRIYSTHVGNAFMLYFTPDRRSFKEKVTGRVLIKFEVMTNGTGDTLLPADGYISILCWDVKPATTTTSTTTAPTATTTTTTVATTPVATTTAATTTTATTTAATTITTAKSTTAAPIARTVPPVTTTSPSSRKPYVVTGVSTVSRIPATSTNTHTTKPSSQAPKEKQAQLDETSIDDDSEGMLNSNFLYYIVGGGSMVGFLLVVCVVIACIIMRSREQDEQKVVLDFSQTPEPAGEESQSQAQKHLPILSL